MIELARAEVSAGDQITGTVTLPLEARAPRRLTVRLGWRTEGCGRAREQDLAEGRVVAEVSAAPGGAAGAGPVPVSFALEIPADGPVSYDGKLFRILWEVQVWADLPWASDHVEVTPLRVVPRRVSQDPA